MADFLATLGLQDTGVEKGLRAALEKEKRYAAEVKRINRTMGDDAARAFQRITRAQQRAENGQQRFARGAIRAGQGVERGWRAASSSIGIAAGVVTGSIAATTAAANRYAERWDSAAASTVRMRREADLLGNSFDRLGMVGSQLASRSGFRGLFASGLDAVSEFFAGDGLQRQERRELRRRELEDADRGRLAQMQREGRVGAAAITGARLERDAAIRQIDGDETLTPGQRAVRKRIAREEFAEIERQNLTRDAVANRSRALRATAISAGSDVASRFAGARAGLEAERGEAVHNALNAPGTRAQRLRDAEAINASFDDRLDRLNREEQAAKSLLAIERQRSDLAIQEAGRPTRDTSLRASRLRYDAELAQTNLIDDPDARDIARRGATGAFLARQHTIEREFNGRERAIRHAIEDHDLARMDRLGQTQRADRIRARRRFEEDRRQAERSLGAEAARPFVQRLEAQYQETLAMIGVQRGRTLGTIDPRAGGFAGIRGRVGVSPETRFLERIARNTEGTIQIRSR